MPAGQDSVMTRGNSLARIVRTRTGCTRCKVRKKKCDEQQPVCQACQRNGFKCIWPVARDVDTRMTSPNAGLPANCSSKPRAMVSPICSNESNSLSPDQSYFLTITDDQAPCSDATSYNMEWTDFDLEVEQILSNIDDLHNLHTLTREEALTNTAQDISDSSPTNLGLNLSIHSPRRSSSIPSPLHVISEGGGIEWRPFNDGNLVLEHYIANTAVSMSNGCVSKNPFLTQLIPIAFSSHIIMHLLMAQSAVHRSIKEPDFPNTRACSRYSKSIEIYRSSISQYVNGRQSGLLQLGVGALILCFTETARGDTTGATFRHLNAAKFILVKLLTLPSSNIQTTLRDFLIEYYCCTSTLSMISIDTKCNDTILLDPILADEAVRLVSEGYVGDICGCWLEMLLLIPQISNLQRDCDEDWQEGISAFLSLQRQILQWVPQGSPTSDGSLVGCIYKHALLLYLYTWSGSTQNNNTQHTTDMTKPRYRDALINQTTIDALAAVLLLRGDARIGTSLCWPLAVIGSCLRDGGQQSTIRLRLTTMFETIRLGNILRTLQLLELIWAGGEEYFGPWKIAKVMSRHGILVSFV